MMLFQFLKLVEEAKKEIKEIDVEELRRLIRDRDCTVIDVREPQEVVHGKINGAIPIPRGVLEMQIGHLLGDVDQPVVQYCAGGNHSALTAQSLKKWVSAT